MKLNILNSKVLLGVFSLLLAVSSIFAQLPGQQAPGTILQDNGGDSAAEKIVKVGDFQGSFVPAATPEKEWNREIEKKWVLDFKGAFRIRKRLLIVAKSYPLASTRCGSKQAKGIGYTLSLAISRIPRPHDCARCFGSTSKRKALARRSLSSS
mgnify:CR=1 FL=1